MVVIELDADSPRARSGMQAWTVRDAELPAVRRQRAAVGRLLGADTRGLLPVADRDRGRSPLET